MMRRFKVISLDLDGTLISHEFTDLFWREYIPTLYAEAHNLNFDEAKKIVLKAYDSISQDDLRWYLPSYWFDRFGLKISVEASLERIKDKVKIYPDVEDMLRELKGRTLVALSRASREFVDFWCRVLGNPFFRTFSSTSDFHLIDKTESFYRSVCNILGVSPEEVVHVGNEYFSDFIFPRKVGITAFLLDRSGKVKDPYVVKSLTEFTQKLRTYENNQER